MKYSLEIDKEKCATAYGRDLHISPKHSREVCKELVGKKVENAEKILKEVIDLKRAVKFTRYNLHLAHKRGIGPGRYPVKVSGALLSLLKECVSNAEFKGLDSENLRVVHASAYPGRKIKRYIPRAQGKSSAHNEQTTNVEIVVEEGEA